MSDQEAHICRECFEVNVGFHSVKNGQKICNDCGGVVLNLQETADYIAELQSEIAALRGVYGT